MATVSSTQVYVTPNPGIHMATVANMATTTPEATAEKSHPPRKLHRIAVVREQQGISLRTVSRRTGIETRVLRSQENPEVNLSLQDLYRWQDALEVPISDLLEDDSMGLAAPIHQRAQLVRIMKTAVAILEATNHPKVHRMATMLREQLLELMPELETIVGWPTVGSRRPSDNMGRIGSHPIDLRTISLENDENG